MHIHLFGCISSKVVTSPILYLKFKSHLSWVWVAQKDYHVEVCAIIMSLILDFN